MRHTLFVASFVLCLPAVQAKGEPSGDGTRQGLVDMLLEYVQTRYKRVDTSRELLYVSIQRQRLYHIRHGRLVAEYPVSTAAAGLGTRSESGCTPTGLHRIHGKFGADVPSGGILRERRFTGSIAQPAGDGDQITSRVLWLDGLEPGHNRGAGRDSRQRSIYIHGTPHVDHLGRPASKGCIRMCDADVITLFEQVPDGALVVILDN